MPYRSSQGHYYVHRNNDDLYPATKTKSDNISQISFHMAKLHLTLTSDQQNRLTRLLLLEDVNTLIDIHLMRTIMLFSNLVYAVFKLEHFENLNLTSVRGHVVE